MKYLTGYSCCANLHNALVLQQVTRRRGNIPIVFAFVWEDGGYKGASKRDVARDMTEWFYETVLPACVKGNETDCVRTVQKLFVPAAVGIKGEFAAFMAAGKEGFYAWRGSVEIHLLNHCFNRLNRKCLTYQSEEFHMEWVKIEADVGLILGSARFFARLPEGLMKECLEVDAMQSRDRIERHLRETAEAARQRGAGEMAVILVVAQGE